MKKIILYSFTLIGLLFLACAKVSSPTLAQNTEQKTQKITLLMAGDALLHSRVYKDAEKQSNEGLSYDFEPIFKHLKPIIKNYDLKFYNQESILGGVELGLSTYPNFNSPQDFGEQMVKLGFNLVSLANNHTLDRGEKAILNSLDFWHKQDQVLTSGSYASLDEKKQDSIIIKNGFKIGLLAYTYGTNGHKVPQGKEYLVNIYNTQKLQKDIQELRPKVDILLVSMHWGREYSFYPNTEQKELARLLAGLNVDVVIGNHSHYISPIEMIDNTLVIYSLGNLISSQKGLEKRVGSLVGVEFIKESDKIKIQNVSADLFYVYYDADFKNFVIYPFEKLDDKILTNYKQIYKRFSNILLEYDKTIKLGL